MGVNDDLCHNAEQKIRKKRLLLKCGTPLKRLLKKARTATKSSEEYFACYLDCYSPNNNWLS